MSKDKKKGGKTSSPICPHCSKHCDLKHPKCGKGKKYALKLEGKQ